MHQVGVLHSLASLSILVLSYSDTPIKCNCDDQKTGLIDDNVLKSKLQLPVQGKKRNVTSNSS